MRGKCYCFPLWNIKALQNKMNKLFYTTLADHEIMTQRKELKYIFNKKKSKAIKLKCCIIKVWLIIPLDGFLNNNNYNYTDFILHQYKVYTQIYKFILYKIYETVLKVRWKGNHPLFSSYFLCISTRLWLPHSVAQYEVYTILCRKNWLTAIGLRFAEQQV